jgi:hypothetical protein
MAQWALHISTWDLSSRKRPVHSHKSGIQSCGSPVDSVQKRADAIDIHSVSMEKDQVKNDDE